MQSAELSPGTSPNVMGVLSILFIASVLPLSGMPSSVLVSIECAILGLMVVGNTLSLKRMAEIPVRVR